MRAMATTMVAGWLVTLTFAAFSFNVLAADGTHDGFISTSGVGTVQLVPDEARLSLSTSIRGADLPVLQGQADTAVAKVLDALERRNIPDKDISATQIRINPVFRYDQQEQRRIQEGYEVERTVSVVLRDLALIGPVVKDATSLGVTSISPPSLDSSKREQAFQEALGLAVKQARERAEAIARAASVDLGRVYSVTTGGSSPPPMPVARMAMVAADAESSANTYKPGEMKVEARVNATFMVVE